MLHATQRRATCFRTSDGITTLPNASHYQQQQWRLGWMSQPVSDVWCSLLTRCCFTLDPPAAVCSFVSFCGSASLGNAVLGVRNSRRLPTHSIKHSSSATLHTTREHQISDPRTHQRRNSPSPNVDDAPPTSHFKRHSHSRTRTQHSHAQPPLSCITSLSLRGHPLTLSLAFL